MDKQFSPEELHQFADGELPEELLAEYPVAKKPDLEAPNHIDYDIQMSGTYAGRFEVILAILACILIGVGLILLYMLFTKTPFCNIVMLLSFFIGGVATFSWWTSYRLKHFG